MLWSLEDVKEPTIMSILDYTNLKSINAPGVPDKKTMMVSLDDVQKLVAADLGVSADRVDLVGISANSVLLTVKDPSGYDPVAKTFTFAEGVTFEVG